MNYLEPNLVALAWFTLLWSVCCLGFLQLAGMYPLRAGRAGEARNPVLLVFGNTACGCSQPMLVASCIRPRSGSVSARRPSTSRR